MARGFLAPLDWGASVLLGSAEGFGLGCSAPLAGCRTPGGCEPLEGSARFGGCGPLAGPSALGEWKPLEGSAGPGDCGTLRELGLLDGNAVWFFGGGLTFLVEG